MIISITDNITSAFPLMDLPRASLLALAVTGSPAGPVNPSGGRLSPRCEAPRPVSPGRSQGYRRALHGARDALLPRADRGRRRDSDASDHAPARRGTGTASFADKRVASLHGVTGLTGD